MKFLSGYIELINKKRLFAVGIFNLVIAIVLIAFNLYDVLGIDLYSSEFFAFLAVSCVFAVMFYFFMNLILTCIVSIIIIPFNNKFDLKYLYFINYLFFSQTLLLNTIALIISIHFQGIIWLCYTMSLVLYIPLILIYYNTLVQKAYVFEKGAKVVSMLLLLVPVILIVINKFIL